MNTSKRRLSPLRGDSSLALIEEGMSLIEDLRNCSDFETSNQRDKVNSHLLCLSEHSARLFQFVKCVLGLELNSLGVVVEKAHGVEVEKQHVKFLAKEWLLGSTVCHVLTGELGVATIGLSDWLRHFEGCIPERDRGTRCKRVYWLCLWRVDQYVKLLKMKDAQCWKNVHEAFPHGTLGLPVKEESRVDWNVAGVAAGVKEDVDGVGLGKRPLQEEKDEEVGILTDGRDIFVNSNNEIPGFSLTKLVSSGANSMLVSEKQLLFLFGYTPNGSVNRVKMKRDPCLCTPEEMHAILRGLNHVAGHRMNPDGMKSKAQSFKPKEVHLALKHAKSLFADGILPSESFGTESKSEMSAKWRLAMERADKSKRISMMNTGCVSPRHEEVYLGAHAGNVTVASATYAISRFKTKMEEKGLCFEHILPQSHTIWKELKLLGASGKMVVEVNVPFFADVCLFAGVEDVQMLKNHKGQVLAPFVMGSPGLTRKTMDALMEHLDKQLFVSVESGGGFQRAAFAKFPGGMHCPSTSVGSNRVITSIEASAVERALMDLQTFVLALLGNAINEHLCVRLGLDVPKPDIGLTPTSFFETLDCFEVVDECVAMRRASHYKKIYCTAPNVCCSEQLVNMYVSSLSWDSENDVLAPAIKKLKTSTDVAWSPVKHLQVQLCQVMKTTCEEYRRFRECAVMTNVVNMLLCNVPGGQSAGFSRHQDVSENRGQDLVSDCFERVYQRHDLCPLPTPDVLMISTDVLMPSSSKADAEVIWTHGASSDPVKVASVVTGNASKVMNHIQGPCCNAQMNYHEVESCGDNVDRSADAVSRKANFRASLTYRSVLVPEFSWAVYVKKQLENGFTKEAYGGNANVHRHRCRYDTKGVFSVPQSVVIDFQIAMPYWEVPTMSGLSLDDTLCQLKLNDLCCPTEMDVLVDAGKKRCEYQQVGFLRPTQDQLSLFHQEVMPVFVDATSSLPTVCRTDDPGFRSDCRPNLHQLLVIAAERQHVDKSSLPWDVDLQSKNPKNESCQFLTRLKSMKMLPQSWCNQWIGCKDKEHGVSGIPRPVKLVALQGNVADACYNAQFVELCLTNGCMPVVVDKHGTRVVDQPIHSVNDFVLCSGTALDCHECPIPSNKFSSLVVDPLRPGVINQSKRYKNDMGKTEAQTALRRSMFSRSDALKKESLCITEDEICATLANEGLLGCVEEENFISHCLSGGTAPSAGERCPSLGSMTMNEIHHRVPERQDPNSVKNRALLASVHRESVVGVLCTGDGQATNTTKKKAITFVGHFVPTEVCAKKQSFADIVSGLQCHHLPTSTHQLNAFAGEKQFNVFKHELPWQIKAKPAFGVETELAIKQSVDDQKPYVPLLISVADNRHVAVDIDGARQCMLNLLWKDHNRQKQKSKTDLEVLAEKCEKDTIHLSVADMDASDVTISGFVEASRNLGSDCVCMTSAKEASLLMLKEEHEKAKRMSMTQLEVIAWTLKKDLSDIGSEDVQGKDIPSHISKQHQHSSLMHDLHACRMEKMHQVQQETLEWLKKRHDLECIQRKTDLEMIALLAKKNDVSLLTWKDVPVELLSKEAVLCEAGRNFEKLKEGVEMNPKCISNSPLLKMCIPSEDFVPNIVCVAAAQGLRMSRTGCLIRAKDMMFHSGPSKKGGKDLMYSVPLFAPYSSWLPEVLRRKCFPGVRVLDVPVLVACSSIVEVFNLWKNTQEHSANMEHANWCRELLDGNLSLRVQGRDKLRLRAVVDQLWVATVQRILGDATFVHSYGNWKKDVGFSTEGYILNCCMPRASSMKQFIRYLAFRCGGYNRSASGAKSKQHERSVHHSITSSVEKLAQFLMKLVPAFSMEKVSDHASSQHGLVTAVVRKWLTMRKQERHRVELVEALSAALSNAGHLQGYIGCRFVAAQAVADYESYIPGFCGEVTLDSVPLGFGAKQGLDSLEFGAQCHNVNRQRPKKRMSRFAHLHDQCVAKLKENSCWRDVMGLNLLAGKLLWQWNNLEYSYVDTEHFLCKIATMLLACTASRTVSNKPMVGTNFAHPSPLKFFESDNIIAHGKKTWEAFIKLKESERRYSYQLDAYKANYVSKEEIIESITAFNDVVHENENSSNEADLSLDATLFFWCPFDKIEV